MQTPKQPQTIQKTLFVPVNSVPLVANLHIGQASSRQANFPNATPNQNFQPINFQPVFKTPNLQNASKHVQNTFVLNVPLKQVIAGQVKQTNPSFAQPNTSTEFAIPKQANLKPQQNLQLTANRFKIVDGEETGSPEVKFTRPNNAQASSIRPSPSSIEEQKSFVNSLSTEIKNFKFEPHNNVIDYSSIEKVKTVYF